MPPFETHILDVIEGRKEAPLLKGVLSLLSCPFRGGVFLRNWAYDKGVIPVVKLSCPVVSIGNITAGGTGKTPFIQLLAQELGKNKKVAILTRGYRSQVENSIVKIEERDAQKFGDEPTLLKQKLPQASIWVGKERCKSGELAAKEGAQLILLDDGMQYRALHRDIEIVIVDGRDPLGKGAFLPKGLLRDFPERLKKADLIIASHINNEAEFNACRVQLLPYTQAPIAGIQYRFKNPDLQGKKVGAFCAIAKPERFFQMLKAAGGELVDCLVAPDHAAFPEKQLQAFAERCKALGTEFLVCTEKDQVKVNSSFSLPVKILEIEIVWT